MRFSTGFWDDGSTMDGHCVSGVVVPEVSDPAGGVLCRLEGALSLTSVGYAEHARLKEHVSSMNGGLEAKIHEG